MSRREAVWYERDANDVRTGRTIAVIYDGSLRHVGVATCCLETKGKRTADQFSKKLGRKIALGRAGKQFGAFGKAGDDRYTIDLDDYPNLKAEDTIRDVPGWLIIDRPLAPKGE